MGIPRKTLLTLMMSSASVCFASTASAQTDSGAQGATIEEVIVTAQRYEESAQRAPIVLETIGAEELNGIADVRQLQNTVPSLQLANGGAYIQTYVRGVGSFNAKSNQETAVAYSLDGVYLYNTTQVSPAMYDLSRIEVLKGPQGTLYGRNASGGAVNLITQGAKLGETEGYIEGEVGNYDLTRLRAAVNIPLVDTFAIRLAGQRIERDGYLSDGTNDDGTTSGRIRALWQPSADISLKINIDAARVDRLGGSAVVYPFVVPGDPWTAMTDPRVDVGPTRLSAFRDASGKLLRQPHDRSDQWAVSTELGWNLGFATLTVLPAYRHEDIDGLSYISGFQIDDDAEVKQKSFEIRLSNQTDKLRWVLGAYYFDVDVDLHYVVANPTPIVGRAVVSDQTTPTRVKSAATFGEATYSVTENFRLIAGLRYTWEKTVVSGFQNNIFAPATVLYRPGIEPGDNAVGGRVSDDAVTWKIGAQYDLTSQSSLFATVSRGFKGGGIYNDLPGTNNTFRPEWVTAYEIGSRNRFLGNTFQLNLEGFFWEIKDQQIAYQGFNAINQIAFVTANAADSEVYGVNADVIWLATPNDRFHFSAEYLHTEYKDFVRVIPAAPAGTRCLTTPAGAGRIALNCSGLSMIRSPEWVGSASYEHRFDLANGGNVTLGGDVTFASSRELTIDFTGQSKDGSYTVVDAQIAYNAPDDRWSAALWGDNLTEEAYANGGNGGRMTINAPRTYGVRVRANF